MFYCSIHWKKIRKFFTVNFIEKKIQKFFTVNFFEKKFRKFLIVNFRPLKQISKFFTATLIEKNFENFLLSILWKKISNIFRKIWKNKGCDRGETQQFSQENPTWPFVWVLTWCPILNMSPHFRQSRVHGTNYLPLI